MNRHISIHLSEEQKVKLGGFYTIKKLVGIVLDYVKPSITCHRDVVIVDNAAGCGAFQEVIGKNDYRFADCDEHACQFLRKSLSAQKVFHCNTLLNVSRNMFDIPETAFVVQVGNPPYNDITSEFRKGTKGQNTCDDDLFDRDLGVSFLRSYNKLRSDVVCVLHPLSYLIKEVNFNRLKEFRSNYVLKKGLIFPSSLFIGTGTIKFPIVIALYERSAKGMDFGHIRSFEFSILDTNKTFVLSNFETIDGYVNKYPPKKGDPKTSTLGLYFYTIRDINALRKNTSFFTRQLPNGIVVEVDTFYKYAYLYALKMHFSPEDIWLYGNLSPLVDTIKLERSKKLFVAYALSTNPALRRLSAEILAKITAYYNISLNGYNSKEHEDQVKNCISALVPHNLIDHKNNNMTLPLFTQDNPITDKVISPA